MRYVTLFVVLVAITGALATFSGLSWRPADAGLAPQQVGERTNADATRALDAHRPEGAALDTVPVNGGDLKDFSGGEKLLARLAADCASHLYEKAKRQPDNLRLLEQAAAHYRACLSHEPTVEDAGLLFANARRDLTQIESLLARATLREAQQKTASTTAPKQAEKTAEKPPVVVAKKDHKPAPIAPPPAPAPKAKAAPKDEPRQYGPDGTLFRKEKASD